MDFVSNLLLLFVIGLTTGTLSGLFGVGGGFILVPLLTLVGLPIKEAIGLSLVYIIGTALSGVISHFKHHTVDLVLALSLSVSSIVTARFGATLAVGIAPGLLKLLFGLLLVVVAVFYFLQPSPKPPNPKPGRPKSATGWWGKLEIARTKTVGDEVYNYRINLLAGLMIGLVVGFMSGMFGVGGGFLMVPLMSAVLGVPLKIAVGTSLLCVIPPAISGSVTLWLANSLDIHLLPALLVGGLIGAQIGAQLVMQLNATILKLAFNLLLISVSVYMLAQGFGIL